MLILSCPVCSHPLKLSLQHIGIKGSCVSCGTPIMAVQSGPDKYEAIQIDPDGNAIHSSSDPDNGHSQAESNPPHSRDASTADPDFNSEPPALQKDFTPLKAPQSQGDNHHSPSVNQASVLFGDSAKTDHQSPAGETTKPEGNAQPARGIPLETATSSKPPEVTSQGRKPSSPKPPSESVEKTSPAEQGKTPAFLPPEVFRTLPEPDPAPGASVADKVTNALWGFREAVERKESRTGLFTTPETADRPLPQESSPKVHSEPEDIESSPPVDPGLNPSPEKPPGSGPQVSQPGSIEDSRSGNKLKNGPAHAVTPACDEAVSQDLADTSPTTLPPTEGIFSPSPFKSGAAGSGTEKSLFDSGPQGSGNNESSFIKPVNETEVKPTELSQPDNHPAKETSPPEATKEKESAPTQSPFSNDSITLESEAVTPFGTSVSLPAGTDSLFSDSSSPLDARKDSMFGSQAETPSSPFGSPASKSEGQPDPFQTDENDEPSSIFGPKTEKPSPAELPEETESQSLDAEPTPEKYPAQSIPTENPFHRPTPAPVEEPVPTTGNGPISDQDSEVDSSNQSIFSNDSPVDNGLQASPFDESDLEDSAPSPELAQKNPFEQDSPTAPVNPLSMSPKSFMDGPPAEESKTPDQPTPLASSSLNEVRNSSPQATNTNYSTLSLKPDKKRQQSLSTEMLLIILFVTSVFMGFAAFSITPREKREEMRIKLGEWLEPASVVIEQLPFTPDKKAEPPGFPANTDQPQLDPSPPGTLQPGHSPLDTLGMSPNPAP